MTEKMLNGDQALALGALVSGVKIVTSYPGSPSSGTVDSIISVAKKYDVYVEWSSNEKVAMEIGIGASIAGRRALICVKSVGLNAMIDPLMALNLTPVHGGLVIILGDDPGAYGSQNDQDSRFLAPFLKMPMMEPAGPAEAYVMMQEAFTVSETYRTAVIIRETRSFTQQQEEVSVLDRIPEQADLGVVREPYRFVPVPKNAVAKHRILNATIDALSEWSDETEYNKVSGKGVKGVVGVGFAYQKILDILGGEPPDTFRLLKLGNIYPLPSRTIIQFLQSCEEVLIVEENGSFIENAIKSLAHEAGRSTRICGKDNNFLKREGEMFRWQIQAALASFYSGYTPLNTYSKENEADERPGKESYCNQCRYDEVLDKFAEAAEHLNLNPVLVGDPGCIVRVADRIDAKYAMGSAVGVADGVSKAGCDERAVAIFGDSAFFHTALSAICNAVHNRSDILMIILDNKATTASGFQPNPGVDRDAFGEGAPMLDIEKIVRSIGVQTVYTSSLDDTDPPLKDVFRKALGDRILSLVIVRIPAPIMNHE